jgi:GR25 family glycosyltransferase involved in LPS biosynthesis
MVHFAHWITPRIVPKVFDTQFFVARAPVDHVALHDGSESTDSEWLRPEAAVADAESGKRTLVFPTRMNLLKLAQHKTVDEAMAAARATPVVTVQPEPVAHPKGRTLKIPAEAGYPGSLFLVEDGGTKVTILEAAD